MLFDDMLMFSKNEAVAASKASSVVDILKKGDARINELMLLVRSVADPVGTGTVQLQFRTSDSVNATTGALVNPEILVSTGTVLAANAGNGKDILYVRVPYGAKRYLDVNYTIAGSLALVVWAGLTFDK